MYYFERDEDGVIKDPDLSGVDDLVASVTGTEEEADEFEPAPVFSEDESDELDRRITLAKYYTEAIKTGIFEDNTPTARIVNREVAEFVRSRLRSLLGMDTPVPQQVIQVQKVELPFTDDQIKALGLLADSVLKKQKPDEPKLAVQKATPVEPPPIEVKRKVPPVAPQAKAKTPPSTPTIAAPVQPAKQAPPKAKTKLKAKVDPDTIEDGVEFTENGQTFVYTTSDHVRDENGNPKRIKQTVTKQVVGAGHRNPQTAAEIEALYAQTTVPLTGLNKV